MGVAYVTSSEEPSLRCLQESLHSFYFRPRTMAIVEHVQRRGKHMKILSENETIVFFLDFCIHILHSYHIIMAFRRNSNHTEYIHTCFVPCNCIPHTHNSEHFTICSIPSDKGQVCHYQKFKHRGGACPGICYLQKKFHVCVSWNYRYETCFIEWCCLHQ